MTNDVDAFLSELYNVKNVTKQKEKISCFVSLLNVRCDMKATPKHFITLFFLSSLYSYFVCLSHDDDVPS